jgi:hypothetical protein
LQLEPHSCYLVCFIDQVNLPLRAQSQWLDGYINVE